MAVKLNKSLAQFVDGLSQEAERTAGGPLRLDALPSDNLHGMHAHQFDPAEPKFPASCDICGRPFRRIGDDVAEDDVWTVSCILDSPRFSLEHGCNIVTYSCHRSCAEHLAKNLPDKLAELFSERTNTEV